jgi:hypothetical protein
MSERKAGRPKKEVVVKRNGDSLQAFRDGVYLGSISVRDLCVYVEQRQKSGGDAAQKDKNTGLPILGRVVCGTENV